MSIEESEHKELDQQIMMEEFRYWDAYRNNVPMEELEEIKLNIKKMKTSLISIEKLKARFLGKTTS